MTSQHAIFLFVAATLGGALNALAGGGSFIAFPALIFTGVPAIPANATNTVALWTGLTASTGAYRKRLDLPKALVIPLLIASVTGGVAGAILLLKTSAATFVQLLPWLMLAATLLFVFGKYLTRHKHAEGHLPSVPAIATATAFELLIGAYGGYFGGGMGFVLLALLSAIGMTDIHRMNALKSVLSTATNGVAVVIFVARGAVYWPQAGVMVLGAIAGGYCGAHYGQKLPPIYVRWFVIAVGAAMTVIFFLRARA